MVADRHHFFFSRQKEINIFIEICYEFPNMSDWKLKITFQDKQDSWVLNNNSKYVLTAGNVNEIKEVVDNISDTIGGLNLFSDVYKYARFIIPILNEACEYELQIEIATNEGFSDPLTISSVDNANLFYIFDGEDWKSFSSLHKTTLTASDFNKSICADIKELIRAENSYFGRYKWKNSFIKLWLYI